MIKNIITTSMLVAAAVAFNVPAMADFTVAADDTETKNANNNVGSLGAGTIGEGGTYIWNCSAWGGASVSSLTGAGTFEVKRANTGGYDMTLDLSGDNTGFTGVIKVYQTTNNTDGSGTNNDTGVKANAFLNLKETNSAVNATIDLGQVSALIVGAEITKIGGLKSTAAGSMYPSVFSKSYSAPTAGRAGSTFLQNDGTERTLEITAGAGVSHNFGGIFGDKQANTDKLNLKMSGQGTQTFSGPVYAGDITVSEGRLGLLGAVRASLIEVVDGIVEVAETTMFDLSNMTADEGGSVYTVITKTGTGAIEGGELLSVNNFKNGDTLFGGRSTVTVTDDAVKFSAIAAATLTWNGTADSNTWNTSTDNKNWTNAGLGGENYFATSDNVIFGNSAASKSVRVQEAGVNAGRMAVSGSGYTFSAGAISATELELSADTGTTAFSSAFSSSGSVIIGSGATLELSSGSISGVISGAGALTKTGAGALTLSGQNTYTGLTTVSEGSLIATRVNALSASSGVVVAADATLQVGTAASVIGDGAFVLPAATGAGTVVLYLTGNLSDTGGGNGAATRIDGMSDFTGNVEVRTGLLNLSDGNDTNAALLNSVAAANKIMLNGGGLLFKNIVSGDNAAKIFTKNIEVKSDSIIRIYGNGNMKISGEVTGTVGTLKRTDGGTLTFTDTVDIAGFTNAAGTTNFNGASTTIGNVYVSAGDVNFNSADTRITGNDGATSGLRQQGGTINVGDGTNAASLTVVNYTGASNAGAAGTFNIKEHAVMTVTGNKSAITGGGHSFQLANYPVTQTFNVDGVLNLSKVSLGVRDGTGIVNVEATGEFNLDAGLSAVSKDSRANSVQVNLEGGTMNIGANGIGNQNVLQLTLTSGTIGSLADSWSSSRAMALGGAITVDTTKKTYTEGAAAATTANGSSITLSGVLSGTGSLAKAGVGVLTLSGANTYSGGTAVNAGTVIADHASALGTGAVSVVSGANLQVVSGVVVNVAGGITLADGAKLLVDLTGHASATDEFTLDLVVGDITVGAETLVAGDVTSTISSIFEAVGFDMTGWEDSWIYTSDKKLQLTISAAIPEPSLFGLFAGLGALALVGARRRRK